MPAPSSGFKWFADTLRLEELLTTCDWPIKKDPTKDYDLLLRGLRACGESANASNKELGTNFESHHLLEKDSTEAGSDCITS
ncbi:unnamed protein product [Strongylus vulgaris]|uniref:Uncharacterized protein n=1 Tax=Strongylus vulgaris TaxID=40348 RepID=A0A3P7IJA9_STRVU|nr:unnamed protein product [Strongylus vulgaris]